MSMKGNFGRILEELWHRRTYEIRSELGLPSKGKPYAWSRQIRQEGIGELISLTTEILRKRAHLELRKITSGRYSKFIRGRGDARRHDRLMRWAKGIKGPILYSFWRGKELLYVGRGTSYRRLNHYRDHTLMRDADRILINTIKGRSQLPKAECLMIHLCEPKKNRIKATMMKYCKACPICKAHSFLKRELKILFD